MIRLIDATDESPILFIRGSDSLRALSVAETGDWVKVGGLPNRAPLNAVADLRRGLDPNGDWIEKALLVRNEDDDPERDGFFVMPYEVFEELAVVQ